MTSYYLRRLGVQGHLQIKAALRRWDPIGVYAGDDDWPEDEYDAYSGPVVALLDGGAARDSILGYLRSVCEHHIEVGFDSSKAGGIVDDLIEFWPLWKQQLKELGPDHLIDDDKSA